MIVTTRSKPTAATVGLAWDGSRLWAGDFDARTISSLDKNGAVSQTFAVPGRPVGLAFADGRLAAVVSHPDTDNRTIRFFDPASQSWFEDALRCPDDTGSHLAWDGGHLWLGQRYNRKLLQLHADGTIKHEIEMPSEIVGFAWTGATLWLNMRIANGVSEVAKRTPGATRPTPLEQIDGSLVSLAYDGSGFWTADLRTDALYKIAY